MTAKFEAKQLKSVKRNIPSVLSVLYHYCLGCYQHDCLYLPFKLFTNIAKHYSSSI